MKKEQILDNDTTTVFDSDPGITPGHNTIDLIYQEEKTHSDESSFLNMFKTPQEKRIQSK